MRRFVIGKYNGKPKLKDCDHSAKQTFFESVQKLRDFPYDLLRIFSKLLEYNKLLISKTSITQ
jgi:hypothetical protein